MIKKKGFSLLEFIIILVIVGFSLKLILTKNQNINNSSKLKKSALLIKKTVMKLHAKSLILNKNYRFMFNFKKNLYQIEKMTKNNWIKKNRIFCL
jgi:type II secretory pathway pseudopilin PulG